MNWSKHRRSLNFSVDRPIGLVLFFLMKGSKSALNALLIIIFSLGACRSKIDPKSADQEAVSYTHLTLPTSDLV